MAEEDNFTLIIPQKSSMPVDQRPTNTESDLLLFDDEPVITTTSDLAAAGKLSMQKEVMLMDFVATALNTTDRHTSTEEDLIVFEDPTVENVMVPPVEEPIRVALEELPVNEHHPSIVASQNTTQKPGTQRDDKRSRSPTKRRPILETPWEDRAEILTTRRLLGSGIERIRAKTLDAHGFRRLQQLVKTRPHSEELPFDELLSALVEYLDHPAGPTEAASTRALIFRTQALACIRAVVALPLHGQAAVRRYPDAICAVVLEAGSYEKASLFGNDLVKTIDEIVKHADEEIIACLDRVLERDWQGYSVDPVARKRIITTSLSTITKLMGSMERKDEDLNLWQRTRMRALVVRYLADHDADIRKAGMDFCLELYAAIGKDNREAFWNGMKGIGEGQLNLLAYYMARRGMA